MILNNNYNPDVLTCLANLSNDEVFTPPQVVNQMLDLLPQELFQSKDTKFLDPVSKSGVFLREIAKRLMVGLAHEIPDIYERADHVFTNQLYGIAITELTALTSRRSLYCSKKANGRYSLCRKFQTEDGNLRFNAIEHKFENGKCKYCGASEDVFGKKYRKDLESHAYEFIHTDKPEKLFPNMKFDVIIGNPPYQLNDGGHGASAIPIYQHFIEQAMKLNPRYLTMIVPARWYAGGRGLDSFREKMLHDKRIKVLVDFFNSEECFPGIDLSGGVCYFLWERDYYGDADVSSSFNGKRTTIKRALLEGEQDTFIRFNEAISIIRKISSFKESSFMTIVSANDPFGYDLRVANSYVRIKPDIKELNFTNALKIHYWGKNGKSVGYIAPESVRKNKEMVGKIKIFISRSYGERGNFPYLVIGKPFIGEKNTVCTETYITVGTYNTEEEARNVVKYMQTKFFRFLVMLKKNTQSATQGVYQFVPLQDFSHPWTDEMLYEKYELTEEEIAFIESMIRPME